MDFDYLINKIDGTIITQRDYQDLYVEIVVDSNKFYVPVSLPRRNPFLAFDLSKKTNALWLYLRNCAEQLKKPKVEEWKDKEIKKLKDNQNSVTNRLLMELLSKESVCYSCFFTGENANPNPQKNIQNLRDRGYIIRTQRAVNCDKCHRSSAQYTLTPVLTSSTQTYETISSELKERICKIFGYRDACSGIENKNVGALIPDHKFPEDRWNDEVAETNSEKMSETEIKRKFQLLTPQYNMQKQRACAKCVQTGERGCPFDIAFYYCGEKCWDAKIPIKGKEAEEGCVGCGWYDLLEWKRKLNEFIAKKEED